MANSSIRNSGRNILGIHNLLIDVTSERLCKNEFVDRNIMSSRKQNAILDIGCGSFTVAKAIQGLEKGKRRVFRMDDIAESDCDLRLVQG